MAATTSAFRPGRKFSFSANTAPYDVASSSHSPSPVPMPPPLSASRTVSNSSGADGGIGGSLIPSSAVGPGGAQLQNGAPQAANTIANKPAVAGGGLYQSCIVLRERLWCVPGFGDRYLAEHAEILRPQPTGASFLEGSSSTPVSAYNDPVTQLFDVFRLGTSLCHLYNLTSPPTPLSTDLGETGSSANACKKLVAKFIMALQHEMGLDADEMFTVMQVYRENTNDWVKVVRCVSKLVDRLEELGILIESERAAHVEDTQAPSDDRAWIVKELLESERKYVQDLEVMQNCSKALQQHDILPADRLHELFSNLNNLVDFQRRCLINIEDNARKPPDEQRFGRVFIMLESNFDVYSPFCSNYNNALDVIASEAHNIQRLRGMPAAEGCYLDPAYELPAFLIKPVQRICKYPLLLEQLLKKSDPNGPYYHELQEGLAIVQRGAAQVNEVRRRQEMHLLAANLGERVVDWRGHQLNTFGELHLCENFVVAKNDTEREYQVYLFQYILLCCKELVPAQPKKNSKSSSLLKQKTNSIGGPKKPKTMLQLKGRIFIKNVTDAIAEQLTMPNGTTQQSLAVHWRVESEDGGPDVTESFSLYCKNDEQLKNWQTTLQRVIAEHPPDRNVANGMHSGASSPINMAGAGAGGRRNTGPSFSSFPQTPISETGHPWPFARAGSQMSHHRMMFEDEDAMTEVMSNGSVTTGRGTPMGGTRFSQPAEQRERQLSMQANDGRPRARTEDQDSSVLSQWRSHSPAMPPPLPRQMSVSGAAAAAAVAAAASASNAEREHTLRKASSSRQLRQNGYLGGPLSISNNGGGGGYPRPPRQLADPMTPTSAEDSSFLPEHMERMQMGRHRGDSAAVPAAHMLRTSSETGQSMSRNRSASTSQMHLPPHLHAAHNAPPLPRSQPGSGFGAEQLHINTAGGGAGSSSNLLRQAAYGNGISAAAAGGGGYGDKRYSGSSNSEVDSNHSGTSRPGSTAASSPLTMSGSSTGGSLPKGAASGQAPIPQQRSGSLSSSGTPAREGSPATMAAGNVVKVHVHYGGDTYVVVVLANTSFASLLEKVAVKVRVCSGNKSVNEGTLRLKYVDEDGDRVSMNDDDDVQMAFDYCRATGEDVELYVM